MQIFSRDDVGRPRAASLIGLPIEIVLSISAYLRESKDLSALAATCRTWNRLLTQRLYEQDAKSGRGTGGGRCITWSIEKRRTEPIQRAIALGIDIFEEKHLSLAAATGDVTLVKTMLKSHRVQQHLPPAQSKTRRKRYLPLVYAIRGGHTEMVSVLLENGAKVDAVGASGDAALMEAVVGQHFTIVKMLLDHGADVSNRMRFYCYGSRGLLARAVELGDVGIVKRILDRQKETISNDEALHYAVQGGHIEMVKLLIQSGCDANSHDAANRTLLYKTAAAGRSELFKVLIECGAVVDCRLSDRGLTLLHVANSVDIVHMLLQRGIPIDVASVDMETPLMTAIRGWNRDVARALLDAGADATMRSSSGFTTLHFTAVAGLSDLIPALIERGVSATGRFEFADDGRTALGIAARAGHADVVRTLLDYNADMYAQAQGQSTPINEAVYSKEILDIMVERGADINASGLDGCRLIHAVVRSTIDGKAKMLEYLQFLNADMGAVDGHGETLLHHTVRICDTKAFRVAMKYCVNINDKNFEGWTPLMIACQRNFSVGVASLLEKGADAHCRVGNRPDGETAYHIALHANANRKILTLLLNVSFGPKGSSLYTNYDQSSLRALVVEYVDQLESQTISDG